MSKKRMANTSSAVWKARTEAAEARCAELPIHRERWQMLVNVIADRLTGGLVVGADGMAVENAILALKQQITAEDMRERAAKLVEDSNYATGRDKRWLAVEIRRIPLENKP